MKTHIQFPAQLAKGRSGIPPFPPFCFLEEGVHGMNRMKKYSELGNYFIEIQAPTKRLAEQVMRRIERAIRKLYASKNDGTGITEWWLEAPEGALAQTESEEEEENHAHKREDT